MTPVTFGSFFGDSVTLDPEKGTLQRRATSLWVSGFTAAQPETFTVVGKTPRGGAPSIETGVRLTLTNAAAGIVWVVTKERTTSKDLSRAMELSGMVNLLGKTPPEVWEERKKRREEAEVARNRGRAASVPATDKIRAHVTAELTRRATADDLSIEAAADLMVKADSATTVGELADLLGVDPQTLTKAKREPGQRSRLFGIGIGLLIAGAAMFLTGILVAAADGELPSGHTTANPQQFTAWDAVAAIGCPTICLGAVLAIAGHVRRTRTAS